MPSAATDPQPGWTDPGDLGDLGGVDREAERELVLLEVRGTFDGRWDEAARAHAGPGEWGASSPTSGWSCCRSKEATGTWRGLAVRRLGQRCRPQGHDGIASLRYRRVGLSDGGEPTVRAHKE
jgi:hypothetical protein